MESDVEGGRAADFDFEVVGVDVDGRDELIEQGALLGIGRFVPDGAEVELGEELQDLIELVDRLDGSRRGLAR